MNYELSLGLRYVWAKNSRHLLIGILAMVGMTICVAAVIFILSLLSGFGDQIRERILGYVSHAQISSLGNLYGWEEVVEQIYAKQAIEDMGVIGVAPFVDGQGLVLNGSQMSGTIVRGVVPANEKQVTDIHDNVVIGDIDELNNGEFGVFLGVGLAAKLGFFPSGLEVPPADPVELDEWQQQVTPLLRGRTVDLLIPKASATPAGVIPRMRRLKLKGIVQFGMSQYDSSVMVMHAEDASLLYQMRGGVSGIRLKLDDPETANEVNQKIVDLLGGTYRVSTWKSSHPNLLAAIELEKTAMFVVMCIVTLITSFIILATMIILVSEKRADIAILRTIGATPKSIIKLFLMTGVTIGLIGITLGITIGVLLSYFINEIKALVEWVIGAEILPADIYYVSELSREINWSAVAGISAVAMGLCIIFTLIPAIQASRTQPAEVLRYE